MKIAIFITVVMIITMITVMICGCGENMRTENTGNHSIMYFTDPETKVEYIIYGNGYQGGVCPRYKQDGSLFIDD